MRNRSRLLPAGGLILLAVLSVMVLPGCGDGRPERVPVSGQVLIDGEPLGVGFIRLVPENARPASARIGPDGRFTLGTFEQDDGAVPGTHPVVVRAGEALTPEMSSHTSAHARIAGRRQRLIAAAQGMELPAEPTTDGWLRELTLEEGLTASVRTATAATTHRRASDKGLIGIELDEYGFFKAKDILANPIETNAPGIFVAGCCHGPRDIPESVTEASGAAAKVAEVIGSASMRSD